jgi:hypothetical protein
VHRWILVQLVTGLIFGNKFDFWQQVCNKFLDNNYNVPELPNIPYNEVFIDEKTRLEYDVKKCHSPWVTATHCRNWYNATSNTFATYKKNFDRSGTHSFDIRLGMEQYCNDFCQGEKHAAFFGALLQARGTDCVDYHNGQVPIAAQLEGFDLDLPLNEVITTSKTSDVASLVVK